MKYWQKQHFVYCTDSYEGLSHEGIASQIIHSILAWKTHKSSTRNDCQLVVNHLIRAYHVRLTVESKQPMPSSQEAIRERARGNKPVKEHAIPVACIMAHLLDKAVDGECKDAKALVPAVIKILDDTAFRAWVSKKEHDCWRRPKIDPSIAGMPIQN